MKSSEFIQQQKEFSEIRTLKDGTLVRFRFLEPDDKAKFLDGMNRLSEQSLYLRFFSPRHRLSEPELRFLTEVDGKDHVAIVAMRVLSDGKEGEGLGVARFVRTEDEFDVAEPAVTVTDDVQGKGLGSLLCRFLSMVAAKRGVARFRCHVLAHNTRVIRLIREIDPAATFQCTGEILVAEFSALQCPQG